MRTWKRVGRSPNYRYRSQLDGNESQLIASVVNSLVELFDEREQTAPHDELAAITGITVGHSTAPTDATLGRLLPDFHRPDQDEELCAETVNGNVNAALRSVNEPHIISAKRAAAQTLLDSLPMNGGNLELTEAQALEWLTALNDVRLALGAMLGITEDTPEELPYDDPKAGHLEVYRWLTLVQMLLVEELMR
ncbi:DUF2017 domain-containing protein [Gordonia sp. TBRC 11910]|uniref:DUF2017 domain-containing protein n=1 Tax=Gordonia asplenii TaxID=2725283 RepID=A0A848L6H2_9ACTN|nr:DUF2017 domain-containing protein [Gordonia asplenii]NMO04283.1 DUF2017 domain-containing protein [Gordonia asplenii]